MALQSCTNWGKGARCLNPLRDQSLDVGCPWEVLRPRVRADGKFQKGARLWVISSNTPAARKQALESWGTGGVLGGVPDSYRWKDWGIENKLVTSSQINRKQHRWGGTPALLDSCTSPNQCAMLPQGTQEQLGTKEKVSWSVVATNASRSIQR